MNPENENNRILNHNYSTQEDVELIIESIIAKKTNIEEQVPFLILKANKTEKIWNFLFDDKGNPRGNFRVSNESKKNIEKLAKECNRAPQSVESNYHGYKDPSLAWQNVKLSISSKISIKSNPEFLSNEDLDNLSQGYGIKKVINGEEIIFGLAKDLHDNVPFPRENKNVVENYKKQIADEYPSQKNRISEYDDIIKQLGVAKRQLPIAPREVVIDQDFGSGSKK